MIVDYLGIIFIISLDLVNSTKSYIVAELLKLLLM